MKIYAYLAIFFIVIGALGTSANFIHNAGYDKRDSEIRDEAIKAQNEAIEKRMDEWLTTQEAAEATIIIEERIVEVIREIEKEIPTVVEKLVFVRPECNDLGPDIVGVLNAQIRASNNRENSIADPTISVAPGMP